MIIQSQNLDRKRNDTAKNQAIRELTQISSQMSSGLPRVRKEHVDEARRHAEEIAKTRDTMNNHPRRGEIAKEIRVLEDRLKSISTTIEQDSKIRDQLRLRFNEQSEIDMLERQVSQEFDVLNDLVRDGIEHKLCKKRGKNRSSSSSSSNQWEEQFAEFEAHARMPRESVLFNWENTQLSRGPFGLDYEIKKENELNEGGNWSDRKVRLENLDCAKEL